MYKLCPRCGAETPFPLAGDDENPVLECGQCGHRFSWFEDTASLAPGDLLGRLQLIEVRGSGGCGVVWRARDLDLQRDVAVKFLNREIITHRDKARFLREARTAANLKHPHIVAVHQVGEHAVRRPAGKQGGQPRYEELPPQLFIVSELICGEGLDRRVGVAPLPTPRQAVAMLAPIAEALAVAHAAGVVHRDVKPSNIMIDRDGAPHLLDFGISKSDTAAPTMTQDGAVVGSVGYMSPEQARGENQHIDCRTDVFAFGVVLFELLTGRLPFTGSAAQMQLAVADPTRDAPRLRSIAPALPRDLETICARCLEKDPDKRFPTARELADELRRYEEGLPILSRPISMGERALRWRRRNPAAAALAAAVLLVTFIAGAWSAYVNRERASLTTAMEQQRTQLAEQTQQITVQQVQIEVKEKEVQEKAALAETEAKRATTAEERRAWQRYVQDVQGMQAAWEAGEIELLHNLLGRHDPQRSGTALEDSGLEWRYWRHVLRSSAKVYKNTATCRSLAFSPDGRYLAACDDVAVTLWDLDAGVEQGRWTIGNGRRTNVQDATDQYVCDSSVAFSRDGSLLAATCFLLQRNNHRSGSLRVWDVVTGRERLSVQNDRYLAGRAVAISPDQRYVCAGGYNNHWKCWNLETGEEELPQAGLGQQAVGPRLLPQPHMGTVWDGRKVVSHFGFSQDGKVLYAGCREQGLDCWSWPDLNRRGIHQFAYGLRQPRVQGIVDFRPHGGPRFFHIDDGWLTILQPKNPPLDNHLMPAWDEQKLNDRSHLTCVAVNSHLVAVGGYDKLIRVWNTAISPISKSRDLVGHLGAVYCLAYGPDGQLASADSRGEIRLWSKGDARLVRLPLPVDVTNSSKWYTHWYSATGAVTAAIDRQANAFTIRRTENGAAMGNVLMQDEQVADVKFSLDEKFLAVALEGLQRKGIKRLIVWDLERGKEVRTFENPYLTWGGYMTFQHQGDLLAWSDGKQTHLIDRATGSEVRTLPAGGRFLNFSPSGRLIAIDEGRNVSVWDAASGEQRYTLTSDMTSRSAVAFDVAEKQLALVGSRIELRDLETGLAAPAAFGDAVGAEAAFSRDGQRLYVVANGGGAVDVCCALTGIRMLQIRCQPPVTAPEALDVMFEKLALAWSAGP